MTLLASGLGPGGDRAGSQTAPWQSLLTIRRLWVVSAFGVCALYAAWAALSSQYEPDRLWGVTAACGYAVAALAVLAWRSRGIDMALAAGFCGALLVPVAWMAWNGQGQPDVRVVERSAAMLVRHGTLYPPSAVLAHTQNPDAYNPYLPVMSLLGLPRALAGPGLLSDPRVWSGLTFMVAFTAALAVAGGRDVFRWSVFIAGSPIISIELATGATDAPIAALLCLGFAFLWGRPHAVPGRPHDAALAGLAFGAASAMKATAWPALAVAVALLAARDGRRAAARFATVAVGVAAASIVPFAALGPGRFVTNTILFPLGLAHVRSQAASPLPGYLIAQAGHTGHLLAIALLVAGALAVGISLVVKPLRTVPGAAVRLIIGLTLMIVLAPSTRFGYFLYPGCILAWLIICLLGRRSRTGKEQPAAVARGLSGSEVGGHIGAGEGAGVLADVGVARDAAVLLGDTAGAT